MVTVAGGCAERRATTRYWRRMHHRRSKNLIRFEFFRRRLIQCTVLKNKWCSLPHKPSIDALMDAPLAVAPIKSLDVLVQ